MQNGYDFSEYSNKSCHYLLCVIHWNLREKWFYLSNLCCMYGVIQNEPPYFISCSFQILLFILHPYPLVLSPSDRRESFLQGTKSILLTILCSPFMYLCSQISQVYITLSRALSFTVQVLLSFAHLPN